MKKNIERIKSQYRFPTYPFFDFLLVFLSSILVFMLGQFNSIIIPILCTTIVASYVICLGNGRISMNIEDCRFTIFYETIKYKFFIYNTCTSDFPLKMSKVDYIYQIIGLILLPIGWLLSGVCILMNYLFSLEEKWSELIRTPLSITIFIYSMIIVVLASIFRLFFSIYEESWCKKSKTKKRT